MKDSFRVDVSYITAVNFEPRRKAASGLVGPYRVTEHGFFLDTGDNFILSGSLEAKIQSHRTGEERYHL